ncbi:hypothetical protein PV04_05665 [Phialophora macrospora]|uniref:Uncharacterized protein n=1 Tax=Phialophora macrospora TaxID=1851006 RepID=A0A0D2G2I9_9EURO|nr:hypothetical protein PV04_05665 [Phialophora macrospora]
MASARNVSGELAFRPAEKPVGNANFAVTVPEDRTGDSVPKAGEEADSIPAVARTKRKREEGGVAGRPTVVRIPKGERNWAIKLVDTKSLVVKTVFDDGRGIKVTTTRDGTTYEVDPLRQEEVAREEAEQAHGCLQPPGRG